MGATCKLGEIEIFLPDASTSYFFIKEDLAALFQLETNNEAVKLLRKTVREKIEPKIYRRIDFDYESSEVIVRTTQAELILKITIMIYELAKVNLSKKEINIAENKLSTHKRPRKQRWTEGDIFQIVLENGIYAFGQVVWKNDTHPVCGLFDMNQTDVPTLEEINNKPFILVLTLTPHSLDNHRWKVLGNTVVKVQMEDVPKEFNGTVRVGAKIFTDGIFEKLANAFYGVIQWNVFPKEDVFDRLLLPGVERPPTAKVSK